MTGVFKTGGHTENEQLNWAIRAYNFDNTVRAFLAHNRNAVVVNIGAGLDTTFQRVDNGSIQWINIELPDVVELRQKLIPDSDREITIAGSVFDFAWIHDINPLVKDCTILFMAAGVLFYFTASKIKALFRKLAGVYPKAHFVFDAVSTRLWVLLTNWAILRRKGMDSSALLRWHLKRASHLRKWVETIKVVEEYSMFSKIQPRNDWGKKLIRDLKIANILRMYNMIHVQF